MLIETFTPYVSRSISVFYLLIALTLFYLILGPSTTIKTHNNNLEACVSIAFTTRDTRSEDINSVW